MYVIVVGAGKVGLNLARELIDKGNELTIVENSARIQAVRDRLGDCHAVHCLLIKQSKWKEVQRQVGNRNSQFAKLCADKDCATRIVTWEQFASLCDDPAVSAYLQAQLSRPHPVTPYAFKDGWFERP